VFPPVAVDFNISSNPLSHELAETFNTNKYRTPSVTLNFMIGSHIKTIQIKSRTNAQKAKLQKNEPKLFTEEKTYCSEEGVAIRTKLGQIKVYAVIS